MTLWVQRRNHSVPDCPDVPGHQSSVRGEISGRLMILSVCMLCLLTHAAAVHGQDSNTTSTSAATQKSVTTDIVRVSDQKLNQTLQFAKDMAEKDFADLSFEAITRSLGAGPPYVLQSQQNQNADPSELEVQIGNLVFQKLNALTEIWKSRKFETKQIYLTLRRVVLTTSRQSPINRYQFLEATPKETMLGMSVGRLLVEAAILADETTDLRTTLNDHRTQPLGQVDFHVLSLELSIRTGDYEAVEAELKSVGDESLRLCTRGARDSLLLILRDLRSKPEFRSLAAALLRRTLLAAETATEGPARIDAGAVRLPLILATSEAHQSFVNGDINELIQMSELSERFARVIADSMSVTTRNAFLQEHDRRNIQLLIAAGQTERAVARLRKCLERENQSVPQGAGTLSTTGALWLDMQSLPAEERYSLLLDGAFLPRSDVLRIPTFIRISCELPPDTILATLSPSICETLQTQASTERRQSVSNSFAALLSAAEESGHFDELETRLANSTGDSSHSRTMARICLMFRMNREEDARTLLATLPEPEVLSQAEQDAWMLIVMLQEMARLPQFVPIVNQWLSLRGDDADSRQGILLRELIQRTWPGIDGQPLPEAQRRGLMTAASNFSESQLSGGVTSALWLQHEGVTAHVAGTGNDQLYFPYPLSGQFTITGLGLSLTGQESDCGFDGLCFEPSAAGTFSVSSVRNSSRSVRSLRFHHHGLWDRRTMTITEDALSVYDNGHLVWTGQRRSKGSPWFFLSSSGGRHSCWRDFEISGTVTIPRQVLLADGFDLRGWSCSLLNQNRCDALLASTQGERTDLTKSHDWSCKAGLITGRKQSPPNEIQALTALSAQGLLQYDRPILSGETLTWEFEYQPQSILCHPSLGRTAIVLSERSAALHWIAATPDERFYFPVEQQVTIFEASERPLLTPGWNTGRIVVTDSGADVFINDQKVVTLPTSQSAEVEGSGVQFGLFHYVHQTAAHARNLILQGPWPESLTPEEFSKIVSGERTRSPAPRNTSTERTELNSEQAHWLQDLIDHRSAELATGQILQRTAAMPPAEKLTALKSWVMPDVLSPCWRLYAVPGRRAGKLTSVDQSLALFAKTRSVRSPSLTSPTLELIELASEANQLQTLREEVVALMNEQQPAGPLESAHRGSERLAGAIMLALIDLRLAPAESPESLQQVITFAGTHAVAVTRSNLFGLLMLADATSQSPELSESTRKLLETLPNDVFVRSHQDKALRDLVASLTSLVQIRQEVLKNEETVAPLSGWRAFRLLRAETRAAGLPEGLWIQRADQSLQHVMGTSSDMITWPQLLGDGTQVECRLHAAGGRFPAVGFGGWDFQPNADDDSLHRSRAGRAEDERARPIPVVIDGDECNVRLTVANQTLVLTLNGRKVLEEPWASNRAGWLCFRAAENPGARISNLRIQSSESKLRSMQLDTSQDLDGWAAPWFDDDDVFPKNSPASMDWRSSQAQLVGIRRTILADTGSRSLLRYSRPLLENGTMTWSFFYSKGGRAAWPVIGDQVFVTESGEPPAIHALTGSSWETAAADFRPDRLTPPDKVIAEPQLLENQWNSAELQLNGGKALLLINDQPVMEQILDEENDRFFGVFHWNGETEAAAKDIEWSPTMD